VDWSQKPLVPHSAAPLCGSNMSKETYPYEKRHTKETYECCKETNKWGLRKWKQTYMQKNMRPTKETYSPTDRAQLHRFVDQMCQKRPPYVTRDLQKRTKHVERDIDNRHIYMKWDINMKWDIYISFHIFWRRTKEACKYGMRIQ